LKNTDVVISDLTGFENLSGLFANRQSFKAFIMYSSYFMGMRNAYFCYELGF